MDKKREKIWVQKATDRFKQIKKYEIEYKNSRKEKSEQIKEKLIDAYLGASIALIQAFNINPVPAYVTEIVSIYTKSLPYLSKADLSGIQKNLTVLDKYLRQGEKYSEMDVESDEAEKLFKQRMNALGNIKSLEKLISDKEMLIQSKSKSTTLSLSIASFVLALFFSALNFTGAIVGETKNDFSILGILFFLLGLALIFFYVRSKR